MLCLLLVFLHEVGRKPRKPFEENFPFLVARNQKNSIAVLLYEYFVAGKLEFSWQTNAL